MANPSGNGSNGSDSGQVSYDGEQSASVSTDWTPDEQLILEDGLSMVWFCEFLLAR
ncbi:hypothetical protein HanPI659440_Chr13g0516881 [Helianthus annuus]|nr:hypothetical protein HanPI659440_Chr13g0516881 [Helianthus annuus]